MVVVVAKTPTRSRGMSTPSEIMRNMVLDLQGMNTMRPWRQALAEYLHTEFADLVRVSAVA